ncbi:hypothetical protein XA68_16218 [Ophiocordyceps unilateralis]|uniref:Uncharacterized protein n=1 Tax=Ophiocordyceps unilateralis TaxID=268505 RepID=A0A2A9PLM8_OPHUN|nr:hypothetical protein XA68_16218 [Ophiocordyceps unilateralis]
MLFGKTRSKPKSPETIASGDSPDESPKSRGRRWFSTIRLPGSRVKEDADNSSGHSAPLSSISHAVPSPSQPSYRAHVQRRSSLTNAFHTVKAKCSRDRLPDNEENDETGRVTRLRPHAGINKQMISGPIHGAPIADPPPRLDVLSEIPQDGLQRSSTFRTCLEKAVEDINEKYGTSSSLCLSRNSGNSNYDSILNSRVTQRRDRSSFQPRYRLPTFVQAPAIRARPAASEVKEIPCASDGAVSLRHDIALSAYREADCEPMESSSCRTDRNALRHDVALEVEATKIDSTVGSISTELEVSSSNPKGTEDSVPIPKETLQDSNPQNRQSTPSPPAAADSGASVDKKDTTTMPTSPASIAKSSTSPSRPPSHLCPPWSEVQRPLIDTLLSPQSEAPSSTSAAVTDLHQARNTTLESSTAPAKTERAPTHRPRPQNARHGITPQSELPTAVNILHRARSRALKSSVDPAKADPATWDWPQPQDAQRYGDPRGLRAPSVSELVNKFRRMESPPSIFLRDGAAASTGTGAKPQSPETCRSGFPDESEDDMPSSFCGPTEGEPRLSLTVPHTRSNTTSSDGSGDSMRVELHD